MSSTKVSKGASRRITPKEPKMRVKRLLAERDPKIIENTKKTLLLKGSHSSQTMNDLLQNMVRLSELALRIALLGSNAHMLSVPFDGPQCNEPSNTRS